MPADRPCSGDRAEQAGQKNEITTIREELEKAVALYKGELLPSCYDDWIIPPREGLRQAYLGTLERLVQMLEEQREYPAAIRYGQRLLQHDPLHESTYRHLMRLHALNEDRALTCAITSIIWPCTRPTSPGSRCFAGLSYLHDRLTA